jgi:hypothetical protein
MMNNGSNVIVVKIKGEMEMIGMTTEGKVTVGGQRKARITRIVMEREKEDPIQMEVKEIVMEGEKEDPTQMEVNEIVMEGEKAEDRRMEEEIVKETRSSLEGRPGYTIVLTPRRNQPHIKTESRRREANLGRTTDSKPFLLRQRTVLQHSCRPRYQHQHHTPRPCGTLKTG